jgi:hypothetical protein
MLANETNSTSIELLQHITREIYRVGLTIIFILGVIGHLFNVRLFTRSTLMKNSCCNYFLALSCMALIQLFFGVLVRMLYLGYQIDTREFTLEWWCKTRVSIIYTSYLISSALMTLASFDRYASSCRQTRYRRFCRPIVAHRIIVIVIVVGCIANSHMPFNLVIVNGDCWTGSGSYRIFYDIFFLLIHSVCCPLLSGAFGLLAISNLRRCRLPRLCLDKTRDFQMMTFAQTICAILLTMPFDIHKLYMAVTDHHLKSPMQHEWENLTMCIVRTLWLTYNCAGFYIYSLSSTTFRREFFASFRQRKSP